MGNTVARCIVMFNQQIITFSTIQNLQNSNEML